MLSSGVHGTAQFNTMKMASIVQGGLYLLSREYNGDDECYPKR